LIKAATALQRARAMMVAIRDSDLRAVTERETDDATAGRIPGRAFRRSPHIDAVIRTAANREPQVDLAMPMVATHRSELRFTSVSLLRKRGTGTAKNHIVIALLRLAQTISDHILAVCLIAPSGARVLMKPLLRSAGTETVVANQTARPTTRSRLKVTSVPA